MCMPLDLLWLSLCYSDMTWLKVILFLFWFPFLFLLSVLSVLHGTIWCFQVSVIIQPMENPSFWQVIYLESHWNLTLASQHWERSGLTQPKCPWVLEEQWKAKEVLKLARLTPKPLCSAGLLLSKVCGRSLICGLRFIPRQTPTKCQRSPLDLLLRG